MNLRQPIRGSGSRYAILLARWLFALGFPWSLVAFYCLLQGCGLMIAAPGWSLDQFAGIGFAASATYGLLVWIRFGRVGFWSELLPGLPRLRFWRQAMIFHGASAAWFLLVPLVYPAGLPFAVIGLFHGIWLVLVYLGYQWEREAAAGGFLVSLPGVGNSAPQGRPKLNRE